MSSSVELLVNGTRYVGWEQVAITRGIESFCGGFELSVAERWSGQGQPWMIREGDECVLYAGGEVVVTGYVDKRQLMYSASAHQITVLGRDRAADMLDSSFVPPAGVTVWEFWGVPIRRVVEQLAQPFGVSVTVEVGAGSAELRKKVSVSPGDSSASIVEQLARHAGVLVVQDGRGGLVITKPGTKKATTALVVGPKGNVKSITASFCQDQRFHRYVVMGQNPWANDADPEQSAFVYGEAKDEAVRQARTLVIRPEGQTESIQIAKQRAQWEATVRAARAGAFEVQVHGWHQADGTLWPVNALVDVSAPQVGVDGEMLITQARYQKDNQGGTVTTLSLKRADAFLPEPVIGPSPWEELNDVG